MRVGVSLIIYGTFVFLGNTVQQIWVIDQARGQDGWMLAKFFFCVFMGRDEVEVHKLYTALCCSQSMLLSVACVSCQFLNKEVVGLIA